MIDIMIVAILIVIVGAAIAYIVKAKKSGAKCIGCPAAATCSHCGKASNQGGCHCKGENACNCHADLK